MNIQNMRQRLLGSTMICGVVAAAGLAAAPVAASAQTAAGGGGTTVGEVVVTGSILSRKNYTSDAPLTITTATELQNRGITTVAQAIQTLSANGAGNLPSSFSANGAFAGGAVGASLRGLTTNSTLVLIDGLRAAYYPLADDATRNFVDLNTIPDILIDRVETLKDGASSTYGADAIAGVINIITKKSFEGMQAKAEGGTSQHGGAGTYTFQGIIGHGNLAEDGFNVYLAGEYEHDLPLYNRDRGYPYNTSNQSRLCGTSLSTGGNAPGQVLDGRTCRLNSITNGLQFDGTFRGTVPGTPNASASGNIVPAVAPFDPTNTTQLGRWQLLNPAAGCGSLPSITFTPAMLPGAAQQRTLLGSTLCQQDLTHDYRQISPEEKRYSVNFHITKTIGDNSEFYAEANYYRNEVSALDYSGAPRIRNTATPGEAGSAYSTATIALPAYVCATGVNCGPGNGTLNPNNPFAAAGDVARIYYRFGDIKAWTQDQNSVYRLATGIHGGFGDGWKYSADMTYMVDDLTVNQYGNIYIANLLSAINTGSYNFANPSANSAAVRDFIAPASQQDSNSKLFEVRGNLSKVLMELPGGPLQVGIGGEFHYESIYNPSANPDPLGGDPTQRYMDINPFGVIGSRNVKSAFFEIDAPVIKPVEINIGGRYDSYSTGQSHFSPKVGVRYKINDMLTLRGTWSQGFRVPSLAESNSLPSTGYVTVSAPNNYLAAHGNNGYAENYSMGLTTVGTQGLKPETSTNATVGIVFQPVSNLTFSLDYYRITKENVIAAADYTPAFDAYYSGAPIPAGYKVTAGPADPQFPGATPELLFIQYGFANLNEQFTDGFDYSMTGHWNLGPVGYTMFLDGTYVSRLNTTFADGSVQHYAGTIGPFQITSASGTPRWKLTWANTFTYGPWSATATMYYTSGYELTAEDNGAVRGDCLGSVGTGTPVTFADNATPALCNTKGFTDVDLHVQYQLNKHIQLYTDIQNLFDSAPPYDPTTYGGIDYNPAWAQSGILGRYFKLGVKATF